MAGGAFVYSACEACGAIVADGPAHGLWHARVADVVPLLLAAVTTLDPETGLPVVVTRPATEATEASAAATLKAQAQSALAGNVTYLAIPAPTTVQAVAQVRALTQQMNAIIRLVVRSLS